MRLLNRLNLRGYLLYQRSFSSASVSAQNLAKQSMNGVERTKKPQYFDYLENFINEQGYRKFVAKETMFNFRQLLDEYRELFEIVSATADSSAGDEKDFADLAAKESDECLRALQEIQESMLSQAISDDRDVSDCTFEVRAGVGGKEATTFAEELAKLYLKFFTSNRWDIRFEKDQFEQVEMSEASSLMTMTFEVSGPLSYQLLRHEAGIHRVQRVPKTEKYGRIHTSTVAVSVIPIRENLVAIKDSDLKFEVKNSSGAGGQNVNRNLTCVRCIHVPTGLAVESQETRFQYLNKDIAIRKIKALVNQVEFDRLEQQAKKQKKVQIGIASRSDKIRTYNFPQDRITDHRLGSSEGTMHSIESYMAGEQCHKMRGIIEKLEGQRHRELVQQLRRAIESSFEQQQKTSQKKTGS